MALNGFKDYFKILGISRNATDKEIKSAFRKLARQFHPDLHPNDKKAESEFKEINEAYEILSDQEKKSLMNKTSVIGLKILMGNLEIFILKIMIRTLMSI